MKKLFILFGIYFWSLFADAHTCEPQKVKCPMDGTKVEFCVTRSMTVFGSFYDFQKKGAIGNYYEELINSCPKCHFSGYISDFKRKYSKEQKSKILELLKKYDNVKIDDAKECEIAGEIKELLGAPNDKIANCYLIGSYLVRYDTTRTAYRKLLQTKTLTYLKKAIKANEYKDPSVVATVYYLIGEMYRRTSDFKNAILYFELALSNKEKEDWLEKIANKQKELAVKKDDDNTI